MKMSWVLSGAAAASISLTSFAADTIKIGVASPYSGNLASYGIPVRNAVDLAINEINKKGGANGKKLEMVAVDDVCAANDAITAANKFLAEKVVAVVGHLCSGATEAALGIYKKSKTIVISPASTRVDLTFSKKNPHFFRTIPHDFVQGDTQVKYAVDNLKVKTAAVVHDKSAYGQPLAAYIKEQLEKNNVKIKLFEGITPGAVSYSSIVAKIKKEKVDVVFFEGYHAEAAKIIKTARKKKIKAHFFSGDGVKSDDFLKLSKKYGDGYYMTAPAQSSNKEFINAYKTKFNEAPGQFSLGAYAAVKVIVNAINNTKSTSYDSLKTELHKSSVNTPMGAISFDEKGDLKGAKFAIFQVDGNKYKELK